MKKDQQYVVLKISDIEKYLWDGQQQSLELMCEMIESAKQHTNDSPISDTCIVVEKEWPMYETVQQLVDSWFTE